MADARRGADVKPPRKDAEIKRLAKFYAVDRPPRKRLRTLLDFLKNPSGGAGADGTIAGTVQQLLSGASKEAASAADNSVILGEFWSDLNNPSMLFDVLSDCVSELEALYIPQEHGFRRRKKTLEAEDWNEVFEGLEVLIRNNIPLIHEGWKNQGFTLLFSKLLKRDNHALIKKYAFRCLALYADATRNLQQLSSPALMGLQLGSDGDSGTEDEDNIRGTANLSANRRSTLHLELLRESVDFSPYGGGSITLPDKFINQGVHVEGWIRASPTQAEEPVDMLKFIMDLSLEREDPKILTNPKVNHKARGDRFEYWAELIMRFYMPLLYPKVCIKVKIKEEGDNTGFFHHCPGSFQRVAARWIYKLRSKPECMETLWSKREFAEVIMETVRQRFAYRDNELVLDAIKFYSSICTGGQYVPLGMQSQIHETLRAMISHVSQLFHPSVQLDDPKILLNCIELLELISQRQLDDYTSTYLRKFVISTLDNCATLRDPSNGPILTAMVSVVIHVWMHAAVVSKGSGQQVWLELTIAIRRWLVSPNDAKAIGLEVVNCWKRELRLTSCLLMSLMDEGQSFLKITPDGPVILPNSGADPASKDGAAKPGYLHSSATFLMGVVQDVNDATVLLDRVLHLVPPPTMSSLPPALHLHLLEGLLQLVQLWIDSAICSQRAIPTALQRISPSTLIALFGEWFLSACEVEATEYQNSRCIAIVILCKLCAVRSLNPLTRGHLTVLSRVLYKGITSPYGVVVSTVLQRAASIFTLNLEGMNALVPAFLHTVDRIIIQNIWERAEQSKVKSSEWNRELNAALDVVLSILSLPKRYQHQDFVNWQHKLAKTLAAIGTTDSHGALRELMDEIPNSSEPFHIIAGRVLLRIASLPFTDITNIKKRALWGLYTLIVTHLTAELVERNVLADWIMKVVDFCYALDFSISMAALSILQDLAHFHEGIRVVDPLLVPRIVMTLAVFAQQQVEEASIEVQSAIEAMAAGGGDPSLLFSEDQSNAPGGRTSANRRTSDVDGAEGSHKIKAGTSLKPSNGPPSTPKVDAPTRSASNEREIPALRLIVQKTGAIFECLRFWVMYCPQVLQDSDVKKILFSAIEAAFVGTLPDGDWQREVERARAQARRMSMPLLFLGLQMRASLDNDASQAWLRSFEETSLAAEGLVMHLLHHINGYPSPAGVDQMTSLCSELRDGDETSPYASSGDHQDPSAPASISFVYMNSMVFTVVGSIDSPCVRFIARDMTGLFTWEMTPALPVLGNEVQRKSRRSLLPTRDSAGAQERELLVVGDGGNARGLENFNLHTADFVVRVETRSAFSETAKAGNALCQVCGGEKPRPTETPAANELKLELVQFPRVREKALLSSSVCTSKGNYVFHEEADASDANGNGDKKKAPPVAPKSSSEGDKMPGSGGGNRDERQERLERVAKMHEERNNTAAIVPLLQSASSMVTIKQCACVRRGTSGSAVSVCGLFEMHEREPNIGSLDEERCLLDLVLDSIPMVFRDCGGDTTDKTILGGRYAMNKFNLMDMDHSTNPLVTDSSAIAGFSFLQRLIHDEECYAQLKNFIAKEGTAESKDLVEFCDAVKKYERANVPSERLGHACAIFWEFLSNDGGRSLKFPHHVSFTVQNQIQAGQRALKLALTDEWCLPGTLLQPAMSHLESEYFERSGLLDQFVASLGQPPTANGQDGSKDASSAHQAPAGPVPPQLALFDGFSIMELNARISHLALTYRSADKQANLTASQVQPSGVRHLDDPLGIRVSSLDICRLFLAQAGLLPSATSDAQMRRRIKLLENGPKLERSLRNLDKSPTRETMKIGVIYVAPAQRTQQELLKNERGSAAYDRFLAQLGWEVSLLHHRGFTGGLDCNPRSLSNGKTSLYYAHAHCEVMFHVVTKMPTKPGDPQQIDKKRHVGNDYVHIVWTDNDAHDYDPSTITSHFNDVQIVIHPLRRNQRGLYLVKIYAKDKVPLFGPLQSGMVIHEDDLTTLVRQTAMNANRVCRSQTNVYVPPYPTRKKLVDEIVERYATEYQESQLLSMLFSNGAPVATASAPPPPASVSTGV